MKKCTSRQQYFGVCPARWSRNNSRIMVRVVGVCACVGKYALDMDLKWTRKKKKRKEKKTLWKQVTWSQWESLAFRFERRNVNPAKNIQVHVGMGFPPDSL